MARVLARWPGSRVSTTAAAKASPGAASAAPPGPLEQRSARLPVTQKATGSNPVGTAVVQQIAYVAQESRAPGDPRVRRWVDSAPPVRTKPDSSSG